MSPPGRTPGRAWGHVEPGISLWETPGGDQFFKVEVRAGQGRSGPKFRASHHWQERTLAYARGGVSLFRSRKEALERTQQVVAAVRP